MTPTLWGRWQTRFFLLGTVGVMITLPFCLIFQNVTTPFAVLGYVLLFGLGWDVLYQATLSFRWDGDWPTVFQVAAGLIEAALIWLLAHSVGLPGVDPVLGLGQFLAQYGSIWLAIFIITQGPLRALLPRWRYRGGQWF